MKRNLIVLLLLMLFVASCAKEEKQATLGDQLQKRKFAVIVEAAQVKDVAYRIDSVGTLEAEEDVRIPARVDGAVSRVSFQEGDRVTSLKVLVEIDPERYQLEVARAQANLLKVRAEVDDAEQAYRQRESLRAQDPGWVTQEELRKLQTALEAAKAEVSRVEVDLSLAKKQLSDSRVRAPFAGIINSKTVSTGEYVKSETVVATIARVETLKLRFSVPEVDAGRVQTEQDVQFTVRAMPEKIFKGKVFFISTNADPETRMVEMKAHVQNSDLLLRPGYFASVTLETSVHKSAIMLPEEAVIPTEDGFVSYVVKDGTAYQKKIEIGQRSRGEVEVLKGIEKGELIVVRGGHSLSDGMPVEMKFGT